MDDRGYTFTPLACLLFIPIMIIAIAYGDVANEANMLANIAMGGDVTYTTALNIFQNIEKGAGDAGRNAAYNATRRVIDNASTNSTPIFFSDSKTYMRQRIVSALNDHIITTCRVLEQETGREISINNIPITNYTNQTFFLNDVNITQTEPFGFWVNVREGIPIKVVQKDQVYDGTTPPISTYVTIEGLEDPYVWVNSKFNRSSIIYKYPYATYLSAYGYDYYFADYVDTDLERLYHLWDCLNGTDNPSGITPRPYYFVDPYGLSFFDRLENKTNSTSTSDPSVRMSTFIIGDPLERDYGRAISKVDQEYFRGIVGYQIKIRGNPIADPEGSTFYISEFYRQFFKLSKNYGN